MALVAQFWELVVQYADSGDNRTHRIYRLVEAAYADAAADAAALISAIDAVSDAAIAGYSLNQKFLENALALPASAEIEMNAHFVGRITGDPTDSAVLDIPAPAIAIFTSATGAGRNIVNMGNAAVTALIAMFATAGVATLSDGETWDTATVSGKRVHKKSNKG